jgi:hypothetical protein
LERGLPRSLWKRGKNWGRASELCFFYPSENIFDLINPFLKDKIFKERYLEFLGGGKK